MQTTLRKVRWYVWKFAVVSVTQSEYSDDVLDDCMTVIKDIEATHNFLEEEDVKASKTIKESVGYIRSVRAASMDGEFAMSALTAFTTAEIHFSGEGPSYPACATLWSPLQAFFKDQSGDIRKKLQKCMLSELDDVKVALMAQTTTSKANAGGVAKGGALWHAGYAKSGLDLIPFFTSIEAAVTSMIPLSESNGNKLKQVCFRY